MVDRLILIVIAYYQHSVQHTEHSERNEILAERGGDPASSATSTECFHVDKFPATPIKQVEKQSLVEPVFHTPLWSEHSYARVSSSFYETVPRRTVDSESEEDDIDDSLRLVIDESAYPVDTNKIIGTEDIAPDVESAIVAPPSQAPPAPAATVEPPVDVAIEESLLNPVSKDIRSLGVLELITALDDRIAQKEKQENLEKPLKSKDELAGKAAVKAETGSNELITKRRAGSNSRVAAGNKNMDDVLAKKPKLEVSKVSQASNLNFNSTTFAIHRKSSLRRRHHNVSNACRLGQQTIQKVSNNVWIDRRMNAQRALQCLIRQFSNSSFGSIARFVTSHTPKRAAVSSSNV